MNREIKFRGQFVYTRMDGSFQWVYGDLLHMDPKIGKHRIITEGGAEFEVLAGTVGQYTGLHDKNGKEIYEGDIVRTDVSRANATRNKKYRNFAIRYDAPHFWNGYDTLLMSKWRMEVIGNVYDNPELLKED